MSTNNAQIILAGIKNALGNPEQGPSYFERPAGSTLVGEGLDTSIGVDVASFLKRLAEGGDFSEVTDEVREMGSAFGQCRYFRAQIPEGLTGQEGVAQVKDLTDEELARVALVDGQHQKELQLSGQEPRPTNVLHIIVGNGGNPMEAPNDETATVFTWYPGRITPKVDLPESLEGVSLRDYPNATVKFTQ